MQPKAQRCALPGCDELIEAADSQKARKFCCAAHRVISRQQRRYADEQTAYQAMVAGSPTEPDQPAEAPSDDATPEVSAAEPVEVTSDAAPVESEAPIRPSSKPRRTRAAARPSPTPSSPQPRRTRTWPPTTSTSSSPCSWISKPWIAQRPTTVGTQSATVAPSAPPRPRPLRGRCAAPDQVRTGPPGEPSRAPTMKRARRAASVARRPSRTSARPASSQVVAAG